MYLFIVTNYNFYFANVQFFNITECPHILFVKLFSKFQSPPETIYYVFLVMFFFLSTVDHILSFIRHHLSCRSWIDLNPLYHKEISCCFTHWEDKIHSSGWYFTDNLTNLVICIKIYHHLSFIIALSNTEKTMHLPFTFSPLFHFLKCKKKTYKESIKVSL